MYVLVLFNYYYFQQFGWKLSSKQHLLFHIHFLFFISSDIILNHWFSTRSYFALLGTCEAVLIVTDGGGGCHWHRVGRSQECCWTFYTAAAAQHQPKYSHPLLLHKKWSGPKRVRSDTLRNHVLKQHKNDVNHMLPQLITSPLSFASFNLTWEEMPHWYWVFYSYMQ